MTEINPVQTNDSPAPVAPVTKEETDSFFQRLATNFVRMSNQDRELQHMRYDLQRLNARLDEYVEENTKLKGEITTAYELMKSIEQERDNAKRDLADEQTTTTHLREQLDASNKLASDKADRIAELERQVSELQASNRQAQSERDSFQGNRDYWQRRAVDFEDRLGQSIKDHDAAVRDSTMANIRADKLEARLNQMKAILSPPEEQPPAHEPQTTQENIRF